MTRRVVVVLIAASWLLALAGCAGRKPEFRPAPPPGEAPTWEAVRAAQNTRAAALSPWHGSGVVELRWTTEDGDDRFEQGDADLWVQLPARSALRISKLGDVLLWLGSDQQRYWLFDLLGDPTTLLTAGHDAALAPFGSGALTIRPLTLLDLLGMAPLPEQPLGDPPVQWDAEAGAWAVLAPGGGGTVRILLDEQLLPRRVEALDEAGAVIARSDLEEHRSVEMDGMPPLLWPKMAQVIRITDPAGSGRIDLFLRDQTGRLDRARLERLFDLDRLIESMRPEVVREPGGAEAPRR